LERKTTKYNAEWKQGLLFLFQVLDHLAEQARVKKAERHSQGTVKIEYPLHPLFGRQGTVRREAKYGGVSFFDLVVDGKPVTVAQWMTRPDLCQFLTCGFDPVVDWRTLQQLLHLLDREV
jgi:hypothetical protein